MYFQLSGGQDAVISPWHRGYPGCVVYGKLMYSSGTMPLACLGEGGSLFITDFYQSCGRNGVPMEYLFSVGRGPVCSVRARRLFRMIVRQQTDLCGRYFRELWCLLSGSFCLMPYNRLKDCCSNQEHDFSARQGAAAGWYRGYPGCGWECDIVPDTMSLAAVRRFVYCYHSYN